MKTVSLWYKGCEKTMVISGLAIPLVPKVSDCVVSLGPKMVTSTPFMVWLFEASLILPSKYAPRT